MVSTEKYLLEKLGKLLQIKRLKVAVAESCTGGGIANAMTSLPGSSNWFECGFVTYSNQSKNQLLGISEELINTYGAVSAETAVAMAEAALTHSRAEMAVAVTGIAGPDGGTEDKPIGTIYFAWSAIELTTKTTTVIFSGNRETIRNQTILMALQGLIERVE